MSITKRRYFVALLATLTVIGGLVGGVALAQRETGTLPTTLGADDTQPSLGPETPTRDQLNRAPSGAIGNLSTTQSGGQIMNVATVREDAAGTTSSTTFVDIPGATATITIPAGQAGLFIATFSAESACSGANGWCSVRFMLTGPSGSFEMLPAAGSDFAFDSSDGGTETFASWESHSVQRSFSVGTAGIWTVKAQQLVTAAGLTFRLDDWVLRFERATFP